MVPSWNKKFQKHIFQKKYFVYYIILIRKVPKFFVSPELWLINKSSEFI